MAAIKNNFRCKSELRLGLLWFIAGLGFLSALAQPMQGESFIFMGDSSGETGYSLNVPVGLVTDGELVGLQFDILYDPAIVTVGQIQGGGALVNHSLASENIAAGVVRVLITSLDNSAFANGNLLRIALTFSSAVQENSRSLFLDNIIFSGSAGIRIIERRLTSLALGKSSGSNGAVLDVPLNLASINEVVAVQFDIHYNPSTVTLDSIQGGNALVSHAVDSAGLLDQNVERVIITSTDNAPLNDGGLASVMVTLASAVAENDRSLSIDNVIVSDRNGQLVPEALIPFVQLTAPTGGQQIDENVQVTVSGLAADTDSGGSVSEVEFFANGQSLGVVNQPPYTTIWTATQPGQNILTAMARDNSGFLAISSRVIANVGATATPFQTWLAAHFSDQEQTQQALSGPLADFDGDGIINLFEYAFGLDPRVAATTGMPIILTVEDSGQTYLAIQFQRPVSATDLIYDVEISVNLVDWNSGAGHTVLFSSFTQDGVETRIIRDAIPMNQQNIRTMRLKINEPGL